MCPSRLGLAAGHQAVQTRGEGRGPEGTRGVGKGAGPQRGPAGALLTEAPWGHFLVGRRPFPDSPSPFLDQQGLAWKPLQSLLCSAA